MPKKPTASFVKEIRKNCKNVDEAVNKILAKCGIYTFPIDLNLIANEMGIDLFKVIFKDENLMGILVDNSEPIKPFNSQLFIAVKAGSYSTRKRFTIAHEIAHYILHCDEANNYYERNIHEELSDRSEPEANADFFAASLLMPTEMVKIEFEKIKMVLGNEMNISKLVQILAERFEVSEKVALYRIDELNLCHSF